MRVHFKASQTVKLTVPAQPIPIQHYLRQPHRLVWALVDPSRTQQLSADCFRLKMRPLSFMMLSIQPTVDMRLWTDDEGTLHLRSIACEIRGVEYINQRFHLDLVGQLTPQVVNGTTYLSGRADLQVGVDLPPALWFTPRPILEATGNGVLQSVLLTVKQRLMHHLLTDYCQWASLQPSESIATTGLVALPDSPMA